MQKPNPALFVFGSAVAAVGFFTSPALADELPSEQSSHEPTSTITTPQPTKLEPPQTPPAAPAPSKPSALDTPTSEVTQPAQSGPAQPPIGPAPTPDSPTPDKPSMPIDDGRDDDPGHFEEGDEHAIPENPDPSPGTNEEEPDLPVGDDGLPLDDSADDASDDQESSDILNPGGPDHHYLNPQVGKPDPTNPDDPAGEQPLPRPSAPAPNTPSAPPKPVPAPSKPAPTQSQPRPVTPTTEPSPVPAPVPQPHPIVPGPVPPHTIIPWFPTPTPTPVPTPPRPIVPVVEVVPARQDEDTTPAPTQPQPRPPVLTSVEHIEAGERPAPLPPVTLDPASTPGPSITVVQPINLPTVIAHIASMHRSTTTLTPLEQRATDASAPTPILAVRYTLIHGDTLHTIAETLFVLGLTGQPTLEDVIALIRSVNHLGPDDTLSPGQTVILPILESRLDDAMAALNVASIESTQWQVLTRESVTLDA